MDSHLPWQIVLQVILIMLNAVFACAEIAIISMNDHKLAAMAAQGDKRAVRLARLTSQPARFLATIQVAITLSGFLGSAFAADNFSDPLVDWVITLGVGIPASTLNTIAVILITIILSYFTLVFGELVPKRLAMKKAEALALGMSAMISFISKLFAPIVWVLTASTNGILRLLGIDPSAEEEEVSEEEIQMMLDLGNQKGVIDSEENEMIRNVFKFDDLTVDEFSTHRTEVDILWTEDSPDQWEKTIRETRHSKYPVCHETVDSVVGVLSVKDYYGLEDKSRENVMKNAVTYPFFVPEGVYANVLFQKMKKSRRHFAVVLDEYGGMSGIVTLNDLLEQIVGDLEDEDDEEDTSILFSQIDHNTWEAGGGVSLDDVANKLGIKLPCDEYDTLGGFIFGSYGLIPQDGTQFELDVLDLHIRVLEIRNHRVEKALICKTGE